MAYRHKIKRKDACGNPCHFHDDDCRGCSSFLVCAKQQDGFSAECWCPSCCWTGTWDEALLKIIKQTWLDPEERYSLCPLCGEDVEDVNLD